MFINSGKRLASYTSRDLVQTLWAKAKLSVAGGSSSPSALGDDKDEKGDVNGDATLMKSDKDDATFTRMLLREAGRRLHEFNGQDLSNMVRGKMVAGKRRGNKNN